VVNLGKEIDYPQLDTTIAESLNIPKTVILMECERGYGKEKVVCMFYSTVLDT
jgi:hypothetical protein